MARKPNIPPAPNYYGLIDNDPTVPSADATLGFPEEVVEPKPFADFSKPEDFPGEIRNIIAAAPSRPLFRRMLDRVNDSFTGAPWI